MKTPILLVLLTMVLTAFLLNQSAALVCVLAIVLACSDIIISYLEEDSATKKFLMKWRWAGLAFVLYAGANVATDIPYSYGPAGVFHLLMVIIAAVVAYAIVPPTGNGSWRRTAFTAVIIVAGMMTYQLKGWDIASVPGGNLLVGMRKQIAEKSATQAESLLAIKEGVMKPGQVFHPDKDGQADTTSSALINLPADEKVMILSVVKEVDNVPLMKVQRSNGTPGYYIGGTIGWVLTSAYDKVEAPRTQQATATSGTSPVPFPSLATTKKGEWKTVSFKAGEVIRTGLFFTASNKIYYGNVVGAFKTADRDSAWVIDCDQLNESIRPGSLVLYGVRDGQVDITIQ